MKNLKVGKVKKITVSKAKGKAWDAFSLYIRTRDCLKTTGCASWGLCFTCQKRYHIKMLQAGHFVAGRHNAGLFDERGINAQCFVCNIRLKGNTLEYRRQIIKLYGENAPDEIETRANETKQFKVFQLQEIETHYKAELKKLEA